MASIYRASEAWGILAIVLLGVYLLSGGSLSDLVRGKATSTPPIRVPTPLPAWMVGCTGELLATALSDLKDARQDLDDSAFLTGDAFKAAAYDADSAAVVTAISNLTQSRRAVERLSVPDCIQQAHFSLIGYANAVEREIRACIFDDQCDDMRLESDALFDFESYYRYGMCLSNAPPPSKACDDYYPYRSQSYNSDGTPHRTPEEQATGDAIKAPYLTQSALTDQP